MLFNYVSLTVWKYNNRNRVEGQRLHTEISSSKQWEIQRTETQGDSGFKLQLSQYSWHRWSKQFIELHIGFLPFLLMKAGGRHFCIFLLKHKVCKPKEAPFQLLAALITQIISENGLWTLRIKLFHVSCFDSFSYPLHIKVLLPSLPSETDSLLAF